MLGANGNRSRVEVEAQDTGPIGIADPAHAGALYAGDTTGAAGPIVVLIPAFNEERFIGSVVLKARRQADVVLVVDDGSSDATAEIAEAAGAVVVRQPKNRGKGATLTVGFRKAREFNPSVVVLLDADGQHLPEELGLVIAPVLHGKADIALGSRYLGATSLVPQHRILGHKLFNFLSNSMSGVSVTDSQSGFRAFSPRAIEDLAFRSRGFSVESEMQFLARERKLEVVEVPITIRYQDKPKRPVMAHGMAVLNGLLKLVGQYRPLLFFGVPGLALLLAGLAMGALVVDIYAKLQELSVGYALICVLFTILGSLGLFAGIILHSMRGLLLDAERRS